ncbi:MAG TPA: hypothetical protein VN364_03275 [Bellilinea sp.]|nr:hypothetical protein [Bellilinea sp.]
MESQIKILISTGPLDEEWLVAELYQDDEPLGELREWGKSFIIFPREGGKPWNIPVNDLVETIRTAQERVKYIPTDSSA